MDETDLTYPTDPTDLTDLTYPTEMTGPTHTIASMNDMNYSKWCAI